MTDRTPIEVVIADDHPMVLQGLRAVIEHRPAVALLDLGMPEMHGVQVTQEIRRLAPETAVVVLTMFDDDDAVLAALQAGATGYLLKGTNGPQILAAIRAAAAGAGVMDHGLLGRLARPVSDEGRAVRRPFPDLTSRERDILALVADGLTNAEIGHRLHLSAKTIANNVSMILTKLHVTQRGQAIVLARNAGLGSASHPAD